MNALRDVHAGQERLDRRHFLAALGMGGLALAGASCVRLDSFVRLPGSADQPLVVGLMADPQWPMTFETPHNVDVAMADMRTVPHDFLAVLGDLVQNRPYYYPEYLRTVVKRSKVPVLSLPGNADIGAGLDAYQKATGLPLYYAHRQRGIRFIFLGTLEVEGFELHICKLGAEQLRWFEQELASDLVMTTIVFSHPPIRETTWHSDTSLEKPMYLGESTEVRALFARHPNIRLFAHGHLHHAWDVVDQFGRGMYCLENGVLHVSVGATAWGEGHPYGNGCAFLVIEKDKITVRVRDNVKAAWLDEFERVLPGPTTLA